VRWGARFAGHGVWLWVALCAAALRFWRLGAAALIGDESYYWLWSTRLAPAYYDNAAGVALQVRLSTWIGGQSELGIRWLNALLGVVAVCLAYAIGRRLFSARAGAISAAVLACGAPFVVISRHVYTDALQIALLLLNVYLLIPVANGESAVLPAWRFWAVGLSTAALLNSKYNAYLYALAVLAVLVWRRRALLSDRRTWLAIGIAACGLAPVLLWNAAHDWASFRWQVRHLFGGSSDAATMLRNVGHATVYLTPPVALLAALGLCRVRDGRRLWLLVPALILILPILLGPADSPRNLLAGVVLLLLLAGDVVDRWLGQGGWIARAMLGGLLVLAGLYGLGTTIDAVRPTALPSSSVSGAIRADSAGWREVGALGLRPEATVFAVDYSIASQLRYYTGLPVHTAWGQYRLWGLPSICGAGATEGDVQVLAQHYLDPVRVTERLRDTFADVQGPIEMPMGESKTLRLWTARRCTVDQETFLDRFDFLTLAQAAGAR